MNTHNTARAVDSMTPEELLHGLEGLAPPEEERRRIRESNHEYAKDIIRALEHWSDDLTQRASDRPPGASEILPLATPLSCSDAGQAAHAMNDAAWLIGMLIAKEAA